MRMSCFGVATIAPGSPSIRSSRLRYRSNVRALGQREVAKLLVPGPLLEGLNDAKCDVRRLVMRWIGVRHVVRERADRRRARGGRYDFALRERGRIQPRDEP